MLSRRARYDIDVSKPEKQQAEESLIGQFEEEPGVAVQGEKVRSAVKPPVGKVVRAPKKK